MKIIITDGNHKLSVSPLQQAQFGMDAKDVRELESLWNSGMCVNAQAMARMFGVVIVRAALGSSPIVCIPA